MDGEEQIRRVRRICLALPSATEKLCHHNDGHVAVWIPALPGEQEALVARFPKVYYRPPYVGVKGWVGIELGRIGNEELGEHIAGAWKLIGGVRRRGLG